MTRRARQHRLTLAVITIGTIVVWLFVLPWIARRPAMEAYLDDLDRQGIDGGATYYTELGMMEPILERLEH